MYTDILCTHYIYKRGFYENSGICINLKFINSSLVTNIHEQASPVNTVQKKFVSGQNSYGVNDKFKDPV